MGTVYRETYTKPLPPTAELFFRNGDDGTPRRWASWLDRWGRKKTARVTVARRGRHAGTLRVVMECRTFSARFRDGTGRLRKLGTGCRSKDGAEQVWADLRARAELVRSKILSPAQNAAADHAFRPLNVHLEAYRTHLVAKGVTANHEKDTLARLRRIAAACQFARLPDLGAEPLDGWLSVQTAEGMGASTRNAYRESLVSFGNWCVATGRLVGNPFVRVPKANERADVRRQRRALTEEELRRLVAVAQVRPLADYGRETAKASPGGRWRRRPHTFEGVTEAAARGRRILAKRPDVVARLERRGRQRALAYKALVLTGLRANELRSLTVRQVELDAAAPHAVLKAADEKARRGADIPLRSDLAGDLRAWLADRLAAAQAEAKATGGPIPVRLPADEPVFCVPTGLCRSLKRDLVAAGIARAVRDPRTGRVRIDTADERGRTIDVHALRHTYGTHLSRGGVPLRTAQAAMRHSDPKLTANVYTDPKLLDVAGAHEVLPALPLDAPLCPEASRREATHDAPVATDPPRHGRQNLGQNLGHPNGERGSEYDAADKMEVGRSERLRDGARPKRRCFVAKNARNDTPDTGSDESGRQDLNLRPPGPKPGGTASATSRKGKELRPTATHRLDKILDTECGLGEVAAGDDLVRALVSLDGLALTKAEKTALVRRLLQDRGVS